MHKIKKAIIPVAGMATRMYPMNKVTKKALLPIYDNNRLKPVMAKLCEELDASGIEDIYVIIGENDKETYENLFKKTNKQILSKLSEEDKLYEEKMEKIGEKITYIVQKEQLGLAHAVYLAKEYIPTNEACILLLGDTIYKTNEQKSCVDQLLSYYDEYENTIIALQELQAKELKYFGTVQGTWDNKEKTKISLQTIVEKPSIEYAKNNLMIDGKFYGNFGEFILTQELFEELEKIIRAPIEKGKEYQLMDAFDVIIKRGNAKGLVINGESFDLGNVEAYIQAIKKLQSRNIN